MGHKGTKAGWAGIYMSSYQTDDTYSFPPLFPLFFFLKRTHWHSQRNCYLRVKGRKTKQNQTQRQTSPTSAAQRDQLTRRKQRPEPLEQEPGLTLTRPRPPRLCPAICTHVNFATRTWLLIWHVQLGRNSVMSLTSLWPRAWHLDVKNIRAKILLSASVFTAENRQEVRAGTV